MSDDNTKRFLPILFKSIESYTNILSLSEQDKLKIVSTYNSIDPSIFKGYKFSEILPVLTKYISNELKGQLHNDTQHATQSNKQEAMVSKKPIKSAKPVLDLHMTDMHEYLKHTVETSGETKSDIYAPVVLQEPTEDTTVNDIQINSFLGINDLPTLQMLFNPESLYVHYYLVMDSDYRVTSEETASIKQFKWNYTDSLNVRTGFCNSVGTIRDIIGMRLYQPRIPYLAAMDTDAKRVSLLIEEFASQAFIAENGRKFHFIYRPEYATATTSIELSTEDYNDGIFSFRKPIVTFDTITISFGDPLNVLAFAAGFARFMIAIEFVCYKSDK